MTTESGPPEEPTQRPGHVYRKDAPLPAHLIKPVEPKVKAKLKDVDSAEQAQRLHALGYSAYGGVIFGLFGVVAAGPLGFIVGWLIGTGIIYLITVLFAGRMGSAAATVYMTSGSSTPAKREYSLGDS